jgi:adenosylcobinamide-phosphate synthase
MTWLNTIPSLAWSFALALLVAFAVDRVLGEPRSSWHPVVWMGNYLAWAGRHLQQVAQQGDSYAQRGQSGQRADLLAFALGALAWTVGLGLVGLSTWGLQQGLITLARGGTWAHLAAAGVLLGLLLKPMMAWAMLRHETLAVEQALSAKPEGSIARGRERLKWLVSRDVTQLSEVQVRESVIESLSENLNDSVIAPIFWFLLLGLPGAAMYRFANTADAMWGYPGSYQGRNWQWAGKWAARADDALSWLPARLCALLLMGVAGGLHLWRLSGWRNLRTEAHRTPSPNSGWPMAAMALALNISLQKPNVYTLNPKGQAAQAPHTQQAVQLAARAVACFLGLAVLAVLGLSAHYELPLRTGL